LLAALLAAAIMVGLSALHAAPMATPSPTQATRPRNIAHEILDVEGHAFPTSKAMRQALDVTMADAASRVHAAAKTAAKSQRHAL
jgi:hypothetical protein